MIAQDLASFRARFAGCEAVALIDVSTGTVLAWDAAVKPPQERLDALRDLALGLLRQGSDTALLVTATGARTLARTTISPDEALCAIHAPGSEPWRALNASAAFGSVPG